MPEDVGCASETIGGYIKGIDFEACKADGRTPILIIGEALYQLHRADPDLAGKIPDLRGIVDFRNQLSRGYHLFDPGVEWEAAAD